MTELVLYEEAMCCSTGVCGPDPDDELVAVSAALDQLDDEFADVTVTRANMQHDIEQFLQTDQIAALVEEHGPSVLPLTVIDGEIVARSEYLSYDDLEAALESRTQPQEA